MSKMVLGLDIGITSVGYGVIDVDSNQIIDYGVRLFSEGTSKENEKRRSSRSARRMKSRRRTRKNEMLDLFRNHQFIDDSFKALENPIDIRIKGLKEKLRKEELCTALLHILNHRGSSFETADDEKDEKELGLTKAALSLNSKLLKEGLYVCEIQKKRLEEGKYRGNANNFKTKDYVKEVTKILANQGLKEEINNEIISLIQRRRNFADGPGSFKSQTPYGVVYDENGKVLVGMIEKMKGKCSVYPEEYRAAKMCYRSDLFNLLNDLNNLTIQGEKINVDQKNEVIEVINDKGSITPTQLAKKILNVDLEDIQGFRVDKNDKPILTEFKGYKIIKKTFVETGQEELLTNIELVDEIIEILTKTKEIQRRFDEIKGLDSKLKDETIKLLSSTKGISGYHSLSMKAIKEISKELLNTELNQIQILHNSNLFSIRNENVSKSRKIYADDEAILSPIAKKAQREAMKVVNRLRELHGEFDSIVIETTRDKNSDERKSNIKKKQKYFEDKNKQVKEQIGENTVVNAKTKEKIKLYLEQEGKCIYTGKSMSIKEIIEDPYAYEIDHIIPISISLDDSINNKVLVTHQANQDKSNLTPVVAFRNGKFKGWDLSTYSSFIKSSKLMSKKKKEYLLFDKDITKFDVMKEFINRNLVDTSYANRVVMNTLMSYFKYHNIKTNVHTIRGTATSQFRKRIKLDKDREENFGHHAIDALIVASLKKQNVINDMLKKITIDDVYDDVTGEVIDHNNGKYFDESYINFLVNLKNLDVTKISHKIDTKPNRSIADETIYSTRKIDDKEMVIKKYKDIYDPKFFTFAEDITSDKADKKYLIALHDEKTYSIMKEYIIHWMKEHESDKDAIENNKIKRNPLYDYKVEFGCFRKYSKKKNGPEINQLKYIDCALGNHLSITHNYKTEDKKVVLLQISPYRTDFYLTREGVYKFVTIRYKDVQYYSKEKKYVINKSWYNNEKVKKGIEENAQFQFSLHRNEMVGIAKSEGETGIFNKDYKHDGKTLEIVRFTATNSDMKNMIEVKPISCIGKKRGKPTISKKIKLMKKFSTDVLGNMYEVKNSVLTLEIE